MPEYEWGWLSQATVTCDGPYEHSSGDRVVVISMAKGCILTLPDRQARMSTADMEEFGKFLIEGARTLRAQAFDIARETAESWATLAQRPERGEE